MDGELLHISGFHVLHGGKGSRVDIYAAENKFSYYLLYYKAYFPVPLRKEAAEMMNGCNPFQLQYSCAPYQPLSLLNTIQLMHKEWVIQGHLERLHVKALFYQFVHELLAQIQARRIPAVKADVAEQARRYLEENYTEPATLERLAELLDSSPRHLSRLFKRKTGKSPIDYMVRLRMKKAKEMLVTTEMTLQEIAESIGYPDSYSMAKMFKKQTGIAPIRYRTEKRNGGSCPDLPSDTAVFDIAGKDTLFYIEYDNHSQYKKELNFPMLYSRKPSAAITLLLCLMILLSACSAGKTSGSANSNSLPSTSPASTAATGSNQAAASNPATKIISTAKGDVEIPVNPKRVVVLYLLGDVLAFDVMPVGISDMYKGAAFEKELSGVQALGEWFKPSAEAVLALEPDLIIVPSEETYGMLNKIAPTVYIPYEQMTMEERLNKLAEALGKEKESAKLLADFHKKVEQSKQKLKQAGIYEKTVTIMEGGKGSMAVVSSRNYGRGSQVIYEYLGMKAPAVLQKDIDAGSKAGSSKNVSLEVLHQYSGDYVFRSAYEGMVDLSQNPAWKQIPAVKEGRLFEISFGLSYYNDIYSLDKQLDFVMDSLLQPK
ncbi:helix-turn-helix domain-containing protein [Paenibacillus sp. 1P03SA]|uniref:helix-turn-helix domain-containing protein n=1 Tax=Paenibacillus sp. 1P03SA TaxID=3132294 RepID=UPI0039A018E5